MFQISSIVVRSTFHRVLVLEAVHFDFQIGLEVLDHFALLVLGFSLCRLGSYADELFHAALYLVGTTLVKEANVVIFFLLAAAQQVRINFLHVSEDFAEGRHQVLCTLWFILTQYDIFIIILDGDILLQGRVTIGAPDELLDLSRFQRILYHQPGLQFQVDPFCVVRQFGETLQTFFRPLLILDYFVDDLKQRIIPRGRKYDDFIGVIC